MATVSTSYSVMNENDAVTSTTHASSTVFTQKTGYNAPIGVANVNSLLPAPRPLSHTIVLNTSNCNENSIASTVPIPSSASKHAKHPLASPMRMPLRTMGPTASPVPQQPPPPPQPRVLQQSGVTRPSSTPQQAVTHAVTQPSPIRSQPSLCVTLTLPSPPSLPPVSAMSPHDIIRELVAIACQRDAETAAALGTCHPRLIGGPGAGAVWGYDGNHRTRISTQQDANVYMDTTTAPISGLRDGASVSQRRKDDKMDDIINTASRHLSFREQVEVNNNDSRTKCNAHAAPVAHTIEGTFTVESTPWIGTVPSSLPVETVEKRNLLIATSRCSDVLALRNGGIGLHINQSTPASSIPKRTIESTTTNVPNNAFLSKRSEGSTNSAASGSSVKHDTVHTMPVRLTLRLAPGIPPSTLAFCVPRPRVLPNMLLSGPPPAVGALAAVKRLLALRTRSAQDITLTNTNFNLYCRVWPHAHLTPAQSQLRVQALVAELKSTLGYDYTPPPPPLAPTRLGTAHTSVPLGFDPVMGSTGSSHVGTTTVATQRLSFLSPQKRIASPSTQQLSSTQLLWHRNGNSTSEIEEPFRGTITIGPVASTSTTTTVTNTEVTTVSTTNSNNGNGNGWVTPSKTSTRSQTSEQYSSYQYQSFISPVTLGPSLASSASQTRSGRRVSSQYKQSRVRPTVIFHFASPAATQRHGARTLKSSVTTAGAPLLPHSPSPQLSHQKGNKSDTLTMRLHKQHGNLLGLSASIASTSHNHSEMPSPIQTHRSSSTTAALPPSPATTTSALNQGELQAASPPPVVARYVDATLDFTRGGVRPASFHRGDHAVAIAALEAGMHGMQTQRRAEEGHMRRATGIQPSKHPRGGYLYHAVISDNTASVTIGGHVEIGEEVSHLEYEHRYLAEVAAATKFIDAVTARAWEDEAVAEMDAVAAAKREESAATDTTFAAKAIQRARISWWDQDLEDGYCGTATAIMTSTVDAVNTTANSTQNKSLNSSLEDDDMTFPHMTVGVTLQQMIWNHLHTNSVSESSTTTITDTIANDVVTTLIPEIEALISTEKAIENTTAELHTLDINSTVPQMPTVDGQSIPEEEREKDNAQDIIIDVSQALSIESTVEDIMAPLYQDISSSSLSNHISTSVQEQVLQEHDITCSQVTNTLQSIDVVAPQVTQSNEIDISGITFATSKLSITNGYMDDNDVEITGNISNITDVNIDQAMDAASNIHEVENYSNGMDQNKGIAEEIAHSISFQFASTGELELNSAFDRSSMVTEFDTCQEGDVQQLSDVVSDAVAAFNSAASTIPRTIPSPSTSTSVVDTVQIGIVNDISTDHISTTNPFSGISVHLLQPNVNTPFNSLDVTQPAKNLTDDIDLDADVAAIYARSHKKHSSAMAAAVAHANSLMQTTDQADEDTGDNDELSVDFIRGESINGEDTDEDEDDCAEILDDELIVEETPWLAPSHHGQNTFYSPTSIVHNANEGNNLSKQMSYAATTPVFASTAVFTSTTTITTTVTSGITNAQDAPTPYIDGENADNDSSEGVVHTSNEAINNNILATSLREWVALPSIELT